MIPNDLVVSGYRVPANTVLITDLQTSGHDSRHFSDPNEYAVKADDILSLEVLRFHFLLDLNPNSESQKG